MRTALNHLLFLLAGLLPIAAQITPAQDQPKRPGRNAWFACTSIPDDLENPVKILAGETITELELPPFMASAAVKIPTDGILRIVRAAPNPENPEKPTYLVLAEAKIPDGVREALIILNPLAKPQGDLLFNATVQDLAAFKGGDRLLINLSHSNIRIRFGKTNVIVNSRQAKIYEAPALTKPTNIPIMYEFYHPEQNSWKILSASTVVLRPTRREIVIFNNGTRLGTVKKHGILFPVPQENP